MIRDVDLFSCYACSVFIVSVQVHDFMYFTTGTEAIYYRMFPIPVPASVPAPYLDHIKNSFHEKILSKNLAFLTQ